MKTFSFIIIVLFVMTIHNINNSNIIEFETSVDDKTVIDSLIVGNSLITGNTFTNMSLNIRASNTVVSNNVFHVPPCEDAITINGRPTGVVITSNVFSNR